MEVDLGGSVIQEEVKAEEVDKELEEDDHQEALSCTTVQEREGPAVGVLWVIWVLTLPCLSPLHELGAEGSHQGGLEGRRRKLKGGRAEGEEGGTHLA